MTNQELEIHFKQLLAEYRFTQLADEVSELLNTTQWNKDNLDWRMQCFQFYFEAYQRLADSKNMAKIASQMQVIIEDHDSEISAEMLCKTLISIATVKISQYEFVEGKQYIDKATELIDTDQFPDLAGKAYILLGSMYYQQGEYEKAEKEYEKSLVHFLKSNNAGNIGTSHVYLGMMKFELGNYEDSLKQYRMGELFYIEADNQAGLSSIYNNAGNVYKELADFSSALTSYQKGLDICMKINRKSTMATLFINMGSIQFALEYYENANEYFEQAVKIHDELGNESLVGHCYINLGSSYFMMKEYEKAELHYSQALKIFSEKEDEVNKMSCYTSIGELFIARKEYEKAYEYLSKALDFFTTKQQYSRRINLLHNLGLLFSEFGEADPKKEKALDYLQKAMEAASKEQRKMDMMRIYKSMAGLYAELSDWKHAYEAYDHYNSLNDQIVGNTVRNQAEIIDRNRRLAEYEKKHQIERAAAVEQKKLLTNLLPHEIAERMLKGENRIADEEESVSIFFSDIIGFTAIAKHCSPVDLLSELDEYFSIYDTLALKHGIEKIKTIGDAYMAVCGIPKKVDDHALRMANFAKDIVKASKEFTFNGKHIEIRIGIHSGPVIAGVIGLQKFAYDLWGDAVNIASRLESTGKPNSIHISNDFLESLTKQMGEQPASVSMGETMLKNRGAMQTYLLQMD
ncbi:MAG: adenylate/guanylate cyclase domain-containing protein [Ignavibacteria bacterium]|jgi:adenylate cyclase